MLEPGQRDGNAVAHGVRQRLGVRPGQPEELLDGRGRDTHTVRVRADGHMRGRPREYEIATGGAQASADERVRRWAGRWRRRRHVL